ncbi:MAG: hypothetical protein HOP02_10350 [Methylococcaceae bacterium]|nr:hypothetical protein [Methylococcaceae bacterium]
MSKLSIATYKKSAVHSLRFLYLGIAFYYLGNDVDWTALDGYNWGSNYSFSKWTDFAGVFSVPYKKWITNWATKPVKLVEVAFAEHRLAEKWKESHLI